MVKPERKNIFSIKSRSLEATRNTMIFTYLTSPAEQPLKKAFQDQLRVDYYTPEKIQACICDDTTMLRHCTKEIRKMHEGSNLKDKKYWLRGLEGRP
jgi:hypothetical protein